MSRLGVRWLVVVVLLAAASAFNPRIALVVPGGLAVVMAWRWPRGALHLASFLALAVRPTLDIFSERRIGLGPYSLTPAVLLGLVVLAIATVVLIRRAGEGKRAWPDRLLMSSHVVLLATYVMMLLSALYWYGAVGFGEGLREITRVASVVGALLVMLWWLETEPRAIRWGWTYLAVGALVAIGVAIWQLATGGGFIEPSGLSRIEGTYSHPNAFGQSLVPLITVCVSSASARKAGRGGFWAIATFLALLTTLTYSRTALLALAVSLLLLPLLQARQFGRRALLRGAATVLVVGAIGWVLFGSRIRSRFADVSFRTEAWQQAMAGESENSFQWRIINWAGLVYLGLSHPVTGHGAGMTTHLNPLVNVNNGLPFNAHNDFVRFFFEGGGLGLVGYLLYGWLLCAWMLRQARQGPPSSAWLANAVASCLITMLFLTAGTTELSLHTANLYELYGLVALSAANVNRHIVRSLPAAVDMSASDPRFP